MRDYDELRKTLASLLHKVVADGGSLRAFVEALAAGFGGAAVVLTLGVDGVDPAVEVETAGIEDSHRRAYAAEFALHDPWAERLARRPAGTVGFGYESLPRPLLVASRFYTDWMQPQGLTATPTIHALLDMDKDGFRALISVFRRSDGPALEIEDVALLRDLMPELREAVEAYRGRGTPAATPSVST